MKKFFALSLLLALGGCVSPFTAVQTDFIDPLAAVFHNPNTQYVVTQLRAGAEALACTSINFERFASVFEAQANAGQALQMDNQSAIVISTDACAALGGTVAGTAVVPSSYVAP